MIIRLVFFVCPFKLKLTADNLCLCSENPLIVSIIKFRKVRLRDHSSYFCTSDIGWLPSRMKNNIFLILVRNFIFASDIHYSKVGQKSGSLHCSMKFECIIDWPVKGFRQEHPPFHDHFLIVSLCRFSA